MRSFKNDYRMFMSHPIPHRGEVRWLIGIGDGEQRTLGIWLGCLGTEAVNLTFTSFGHLPPSRQLL